MNHKELFNEVYNKFKEIVKNENGLVTCRDVVIITIPKARTDEFCYPNEHTISAIDLISKMFHKAEFKFKDIDKISITYNLVKVY